MGCMLILLFNEHFFMCTPIKTRHPTKTTCKQLLSPQTRKSNPKESSQCGEDESHHPMRIISRVVFAALISLLDILYFISRYQTLLRRLRSHVNKL